MNRLLLDQGLPRSTAIGMGRADDATILQRARAEARICVTLDADFHSLLAVSREGRPSVIRIRQQGVDAIALAALLQRIWPGIDESVKGGAMVTVTHRSVRVRRLPIVRS